MNFGIRTKLSVLTAVSTVAVAAPGAMAAAGSPPVVALDLSAPWATADTQGNLTGTDIVNAAHPAMIEILWSVTPGPSNASDEAQATLNCGGGQPDQPIPPTPGTGSAAYAYCYYPAAGTYTVTLTGSDVSLHPAVTASITKTVTVIHPDIRIDRYDGDSRYGTNIAVSQAAFPADASAQAVVLARGDQFADALAGVPLAKAKHGPLLLVPGGASTTVLDPNVRTELERVLPRDKDHTVYILGGTGAISQPVEDYIRQTLGYAVVRLAGPTRYATALAVATDPRGLDNPGTVVVARGDDFADALTAGPYASGPYQDASGKPAAILLSDGAGTPASPAGIDAATSAYLTSRFADGGRVTAIGGGATKAVGSLPGSAGHYHWLTGSDRYDTAAEVAFAGWYTSATEVFAASAAGVATGLAFPDALSGGVYMALKGGPLLLTSPNPTDAGPSGFIFEISGRSLSQVPVFGGTQAVPAWTVDAIRTELDQPPSAYADHHLGF